MNQNKWIKLLSPAVSSAEIMAVSRVLTSEWWGMGSETEKLEAEFAKFVGAKYAIALNSCTAALHLAVKAIRPQKNGELIVPALTFVATALVGVYEKYRIKFVDIDARTLCLNPTLVEENISKSTVAVLLVHYAGNLADITYHDKVTVIEDAAHAAGTKGAGTKGRMAVWSFHPVKNVATGDGGMLTTNSYAIAEKTRRLRWFGINLSTFDREKRGYNWEYSINEIGYKYHANDLMSAIARVQLKRLFFLNRRRKQIAEIYNRELKNLPIQLPVTSGNWHLYVIRVETRHRDQLIKYLRKNYVSVGVHYKPLYYYPKLFGCDPKKEALRLPETEKAYREILSLPIHPKLSDTEQEYIITKLRRFFN